MMIILMRWRWRNQTWKQAVSGCVGISTGSRDAFAEVGVDSPLSATVILSVASWIGVIRPQGQTRDMILILLQSSVSDHKGDNSIALCNLFVSSNLWPSFFLNNDQSYDAMHSLRFARLRVFELRSVFLGHFVSVKRYSFLRRQLSNTVGWMYGSGRKRKP
jgi:hypothetical protein